jgi:hypothetical protein
MPHCSRCHNVSTNRLDPPTMCMHPLTYVGTTTFNCCGSSHYCRSSRRHLAGHMEFMWYFFLKLTNMSFLISIFFFELRLLYINFEHTSFDCNHSLTCLPHTEEHSPTLHTHLTHYALLLPDHLQQSWPSCLFWTHDKFGTKS